MRLPESTAVRPISTHMASHLIVATSRANALVLPGTLAAPQELYPDRVMRRDRPDYARLWPKGGSTDQMATAAAGYLAYSGPFTSTSQLGSCTTTLRYPWCPIGLEHRIATDAWQVRRSSSAPTRPRTRASPRFDQPTPADIGYRASASAYSREVLAAAFNTHIDDLPTFPWTPTDPLIVSRVNPVD
jgi:hypothetical protein